MKRLLLAILMTLGLAGGANAALVGRDINGNAGLGSAASSVFLYDTVLNITWLRDANYSKTMGYSGDDGRGGIAADGNGGLSWYAANYWAANLTVGSYSGWRLPTMIANPDPTFINYAGGSDQGYTVRTTSGSTVYSEMASLYFDTLGNKAYCPPGNATCTGAGAPQPGWGLTNTGDFQNMQSAIYWSGREFQQYSTAWYFNTEQGFQSFNSIGANQYALAVRDGDVLATPIPAAAWLMLTGIGALGAAARRRKSLAVQP